MRLLTKPGLIVVVGVALIGLAALIWSLDTSSATANNCAGGYHFHKPSTCHKHCKNGMSPHNSTHGDNCTVKKPTPRPTPRRAKPTPTPTPRPIPLPCPVSVQGFQVASGADSITSSSIRVTWDTPPRSRLHGYKIESCSSAAANCPGATVVGSPSKSVTSHTLGDLDPFTPYYFRITALAPPGSSCQDAAASGLITATTAKMRLVVDNFQVADVTSTTVALQWDAPAATTGLDKYRIESCSSATADCPNATEVATPAKGATTYTATGLTPSTTYYFRITALAIPNSAYLDSIPGDTSGDTKQDGGSRTSDVPDDVVSVTTALPPVVGLATQCSINTATLSWTAPVPTTNIKNFEVQYCTDASCTTPVSAGTPLASATRFTVVGLSPNTDYYFRIRAAGKTGHSDSDWSDTVLCKTAKKPLAALTGFTVDSYTDGGGVPLSWNALVHTALNRYQLDVCSNAQCSTAVTYYTASTHHTHVCARGSSCYFRVRANAKEASDYTHGPWSEFVIVSIPN